MIVSNTLGSVASATARLTVVYPPVFLSAVQSNCTLNLSWSTMPGQKYRLQYKTNLTATAWISLGSSVTATGPVMSAPDTVCANAQKVYRVVLIPQIQ